MSKFYNPWVDNFECFVNKENAKFYEQRRKGLCLIVNRKDKRKKYSKVSMVCLQKNMMIGEA